MKTTRQQLEKRILTLTDMWYRLIGPVHHKDRDCHFDIVERWSYGDKPLYKIIHYGYLVGDYFSEQYPTYELAAKDLVEFLERIIKEEARAQEEDQDR